MGNMSILDQPAQWTSIDPRSMKSLLESFPEQVLAAAQAGRNITLSMPGEIKAIVVTGLGGSAMGGDLVRTIGESQLRYPLVVNRNYDLPGFVDGSTLVIACSYSGNTEETLSAYGQARRAKASVVCITTGGKLEAMAAANGHPVIRMPGGLPPRAALGHSLIALLAAMQAMQIMPDISESIQESVELLKTLRGRYGAGNPESANPAKQLASSLYGKVVVIYGSSGIMESAAYRWRSQIAENAKNLASHHVLPEMNHNELVGWMYPEEVLRNIGVVLLRDKEDHPQTKRRFDLTRDLIAAKSGAIHELWSEGTSLLARALSVIYLGDFVSLYLAYLNHTDPTPVAVIDYLKENLSTPTGSSAADR
jgi:glucose/mannose-6-phosphate isomerase